MYGSSISFPGASIIWTTNTLADVFFLQTWFMSNRQETLSGANV